MTACHSPKPVVLLTDLNNLVSGEDVPPETMRNLDGISKMCPVLKFPSNEQTEPLNLTVNLNKAKGPPKNSDDDLNTQGDDDVIFVKQYKVARQKKALKGQRGRKRKIKTLGSEEEPRRNPARRARNAKRFDEYMDLNLSDNDFVGQFDDEEQAEMCLTPDSEDLEEWNIRNAARRTRPRRKLFVKRRNWGRRRKSDKKTEEKKVPIDDLAPMLYDNLLLMKQFFHNVKLHRKEEKTNGNYDKTDLVETVDMIKRQVIFVAVASNVADTEVVDRLAREESKD